jgi:RNA 2',3'-cyclic 3'-phosphodiesterase
MALSEDIRRAVDQWTGSLRSLGAKIRWVSADNLHVTVKFLGETPEEQLPALIHAARDVLAGVSEFPLTIADSGVFPPKGAPRVLWVGIHQGGEALQDIAGRLNEAVEPLGFPKDTRPFRAHLTIGRVKSSSGMQAVLAEMEHAPDTFGDCRVTEVALQQSRLKSSGAEYTIIKQFALHGSV